MWQHIIRMSGKPPFADGGVMTRIPTYLTNKSRGTFLLQYLFTKNSSLDHLNPA